ncbi:hypothetical protein R3P38DRAFT_530638 [Favolaschia claudopus]|uniref:Uncharacterized protein n=1 Tax=Favolaschia claudopus TaxID=2862362 RepID=A0AAW0CDX0_9AGAR
MTARRRSFHLNVNASHAAITPSLRTGGYGLDAQVGALTTSLLDLARQASAFAFTLMGGCVPGVRSKPRVQRALLAGHLCTSDAAIENAEEGDANPALIEGPTKHMNGGQNTHTRENNDADTLSEYNGDEHDLADARGLQRESAHVTLEIEPTDVEMDSKHTILDELAVSRKKPRVALKPFFMNAVPPVAIGLGVLIPSPGTNELRLLSPLESRCASPKPEFEPSPHLCSSTSPRSQLRANLVSKVSAFTAARLSGSRRSSVSPPHYVPPSTPTAYTDDPFSHLSATTPPASFFPTHPARLCFPSLQLHLNHQQSPTPHQRAGRRPCLRQRTVFFAPVSPRAGTPPPAFWTPHPAGTHSCAIPIKAPPSSFASRAGAKDKENQGLWTAF